MVDGKVRDQAMGLLAAHKVAKVTKQPAPVDLAAYCFQCLNKAERCKCNDMIHEAETYTITSEGFVRAEGKEVRLPPVGDH